MAARRVSLRRHSASGGLGDEGRSKIALQMVRNAVRKLQGTARESFADMLAPDGWRSYDASRPPFTAIQIAGAGMFDKKMARIAIVLSAGAFYACTKIHTPLLVGRRECPHDQPRDVLHNLPVARTTADMPEFNDCQRFLFVNGEAREFGDLFAVFASSKLNQLETQLDEVNSHNPNESPIDSVAVTAAEIKAEGPYPPLGIALDYNCLYMWRTGGSWMARMRQVGPAPGGTCLDPKPLSSLVGKDLVVRRTTYPDSTHPGVTFQPSDYPGLTRWDFDEVNNKQYIVIKCGTGVCEVGDTDLTPTHPLPDDPKLPNIARRTRLIKLWYDRQYLSTLPSPGATLIPGKATTLVPTTIKATILPDPGLDTLDNWTQFNSFRRVATVDMQGQTADAPAFAAYKDHFGFTSTAGAPSWNEIALCFNTKAACGVPSAMVKTCAPGPGSFVPAPPAAYRWYARITNPLGASVYRCSTRYGVVGTLAQPKIPGAARWRWKTVDEGGWMRCTTLGCCELL